MIPHIAFLGDLTVDVYPELHTKRLGGSSFTGAIWAKRLGAKSSVLAAVGSDGAGKEYIHALIQERIGRKRIRVMKGKTSAIEIITDAKGERRYGKWDAGVLSHYHLRKSDHVFLKSQDAFCLVVYDKTVQVLMDLAAYWRLMEKGKSPLRVVDFGDMSQFSFEASFVEGYIDTFDVFFFGLNKDTDERLINTLRELTVTYNKLTVVTLGKYGSLAWLGGKTFVQPAKEVEAVDTTGAGDAFLVAFLVEYLESGDVQGALKKGTILACRAIGSVGAY